MQPRQLIVKLVLFLLATPFLLCGQDGMQMFPLSEVRPGLKGVGRTVFEGDKIVEFQVEILGVLKNAIAPKHDVILGRLSGSPLEKTGVALGMSGSPVYIDGKLLGAVALSFPFSEEPVAGITPIEEMLEVVPEAGLPSPATRPTGVPFRIARAPGDTSGEGRLIPEEGDTVSLLSRSVPPENVGGTLAGLRLPLRFGGFSSETIQAATSLFERIGFEPLQGGNLSAGDSAAVTADLVPGSMVSLLLVRGDLNLNADCTVTLRRGDNLFACGHRVLLQGPTEIPFAQARVLATIPSLIASFKLDAPGTPLGTIRQDRFGAIYGTIGEEARMIPVHIKVDSTLNKQAEYRFEMVQETFLSPLLLNLGVVSTLTATERMLGPSTLEIRGKINLGNGEAIDLEDVISADINTPAAAGAAVSTPLAYLLAGGFYGLRLHDIDLAIVSKNEKHVATLDQVWATKSEVHAGDHIELTAVMRTPSGERITQKIPIYIPANLRDKALSVIVGSGPTINTLQSGLNPMNAPPRDLSQLVRSLNRTRRNNRLYALLMTPQRSFVLQGDEYPSPPPSLVQTLLSDPASLSNLVFSGTSVVGDFETKPSAYSIRGQKTLFLRVAGAGN